MMDFSARILRSFPIAAEVCQGLAEVGFTIPSGSATYGVGEAMGAQNFTQGR